ncbi:MAG: hypothetical protein M1514_01150 [Patescibacteria group bacterium]|nr:hypothetical protein [Patescibacteria group bacterium]
MMKNTLQISSPFNTRFQTPAEGIYQQILLQDIDFLKKNTEQDKILVASFPFEIAFYGERKAIQILPENQSLNQLRRLYHEYLPFDAIYMNWRHLVGPWPTAWWDSNNLDNFKLVKKLPSNSILIKEINNPQTNLISSWSGTSPLKISLSKDKDYLFSTEIYSPKDFYENPPLTVIFKYYDEKGNQFFVQEISDNSLRKDRWNYLSEKLLIPFQAKEVEIAFKEFSLEVKNLTIKDTSLKEVYRENAYKAL